MGFFSWECRHCGHSILSRYSADEPFDWMSRAVALQRNGTLLRGEYDGYGRIDGTELHYTFGSNEPEMYHEKCWEQAGSPYTYTQGSRNAPDQGYFIDDEVYAQCTDPETAKRVREAIDA